MIDLCNHLQPETSEGGKVLGHWLWWCIGNLPKKQLSCVQIYHPKWMILPRRRQLSDFNWIPWFFMKPPFDDFLGILFQSWRWALDKFSPASLPTDFKRSKWKLLWFLEVSSLILSANIWTASDQDIFRKPVAGAREDGAKGLAMGCGTGIAGKSCPDIRRSSADHASLSKSEIILKPARHSGEASCRCGKCCLWCSAFACEVLLELIEGVQDNFSPLFRSSSHKSMIKRLKSILVSVYAGQWLLSIFLISHGQAGLPLHVNILNGKSWKANIGEPKTLPSIQYTYTCYD